jgi:hypothetical protein
MDDRSEVVVDFCFRKRPLRAVTVIFYVSNNHERSLDPPSYGIVLHVSADCLTLAAGNRRAWEATPAEIAKAFTLCGMCTPKRTGESSLQ